MKSSQKIAIALSTTTALVPSLAVGAGAQQSPAAPRGERSRTPIVDASGATASDVSGSKQAAVVAAIDDMVATSARSGVVARRGDVRVTQTKGGSLVVSVGNERVLGSDEEFWKIDGNVVAEQVGVRLSENTKASDTGGGLGFGLTVKGDACRETITPAGNKIESCYKKVWNDSDSNSTWDYYAYHRRASANPIASSQNGRFFVDGLYTDSGEAASRAADMERASDLDPVPGTVVDSNCTTFNLGVSVGGGGVGASAGYSPKMCAKTYTVDPAGATANTFYGIKYDFTAKTLDRGTSHTVAFSMGARSHQGVVPVWNDYTQACFSDNFGVYGCTTGNQPS